MVVGAPQPIMLGPVLQPAYPSEGQGRGPWQAPSGLPSSWSAAGLCADGDAHAASLGTSHTGRIANVSEP